MLTPEARVSPQDLKFVTDAFDLVCERLPGCDHELVASAVICAMKNHPNSAPKISVAAMHLLESATAAAAGFFAAPRIKPLRKLRLKPRIKPLRKPR